MIKRLTLTMILLLPGFIVTTAQDNTKALPSEVVAKIQTEMDDLTAGTFPVWKRCLLF